MTRGDTFVLTSNQPCAAVSSEQALSYPALTFGLDLLRELLGDPLEVTPAERPINDLERIQAFAEYHRERCDCPFPPEPDWE